MKLLDLAAEDMPLESELVARVGWFIQLRWLVGFAVFVAAAMAVALDIGGRRLFPVGVGILAYNAAFAGVHGRLVGRVGARAVHWRLLTHAQIFMDWVALTVLSGLTGGLESPLILFFIFHVILAAMLLPRSDCLLQTTAGLFLISAMARGGLVGPLHLASNPFAIVRIYGNEMHVLAYVLTIGGTLYTCALLASSIAERLRLREHELVDAMMRQERLHGEMALLHELAKSVNATLDLDTVLQRVAEQAATVTAARACSIRLLTESGELLISAAYGLSEKYLSKGSVDLTRSIIDRNALLGQTVLVGDVTQEEIFQYPEEVAREGIRSVLCVPLIAQARPLGVVRVYSSTPGAFGPDDVRFLQHFADLAAIAISNARTCQALEAADRERSRFVRTVAHELRSPLAAMMGNMRVMLRGYTGSLPEKAAQLLERAHERGNLLLALVSDLLALVAGRDAPAAQAQEPVSLAEVIRQVSNDHAAQADAKSLDLRVLIGDGPSDIRGDRSQLIRLMENLVSNAIKYTPDGGRVIVSLVTDEQAIEVAVEDTGIGIPQAALGRIFDEFYRAENAKRLTEQGTGLGLSIAKRIVEAHRGRIAIESEERHGTLVTAVFPRQAAPEGEQGEPPRIA